MYVLNLIKKSVQYSCMKMLFFREVLKLLREKNVQWNFFLQIKCIFIKTLILSPFPP